MVSELSFLGPNSPVRLHASSRVYAFETPPLQSRPITLLPTPIDRSEADMSIAAKTTEIVHVTRRPKILHVQPRATTILQAHC
jgi:hypothetical protein